MNCVREESSSPSSSEDQSDGFADGGAMPTGISEEHFDKHCKYKKYEGIVQGRKVKIYIRICKCRSEYTDRGDLANGKMNLVTENGKEIHFDQACTWLRRKVKRCGHPAYILEKYCNGCTTPEINATSFAMNMPKPSK